MRLRNTLVDNSPQAIHHMQKALFEMNVQLSNVLSDIVGQSGLQIIEAILAGQRDPEQLAALCSSRIKASRQTVANSLHGNWDEALLLALKVAFQSNSISGGKVLRRSTRKVYNRAADALRLGAQSLTTSKTALGAKYRRLRARLGAPKAGDFCGLAEMRRRPSGGALLATPRSCKQAPRKFCLAFTPTSAAQVGRVNAF
jgi:hypothetical protein